MSGFSDDRNWLRLGGSAIGFIAALVALPNVALSQISCNRELSADVVAFDMPLMWNRLGAQNINGQMFALKRDTINLDTELPLTEGGAEVPGRVALRPDKRPRPLVLRMGAGDCLTITLTNLLTPARNPFAPVEVRSGIPFNLNIDDQVADRRISLRFQGTELVNSIADDGSFVGQNPSSLVGPGDPPATYKIYAPAEGTFVGTSYGVTFGGEGQGGNTANGLWAVLNVNPVNSAFYRSQLTEEEMRLAAGDDPATAIDETMRTAQGHPVIDYEATYPMTAPWTSEGKAGLPIINMVDVATGEIVHSDINSITAYGPSLVLAYGPGGLGHFPPSTYPLESVGKRNPSLPNRLEPFREFVVAFHDEVTTKQAFPLWYEDPVLKHTLHSVRDSFMINYGSGGIGTEIIASRLGVGPMHDCINCAYEEFFLTFFTVGEVAQLVDVPANVGLEDCAPTTLAGCEEIGPKATAILFPDDPSNVHHSYVGEFVKMRNLHIGPGEQHIFHQHNHQWLFNANDDNSNYLDAQGIGPGSGYTYEFVFGGAGNRNKTAGDAIFHCHFYPHFAQGMWEMWRIHDTFEPGTELEVSRLGGGVHTDVFGLVDGTPGDVDGDGDTRALPDAEVVAGAPQPALVPIPGKPMAPMPVGKVDVKPNPNLVAQIDPATGLPTGAMIPTGSLSDVETIDADANGVADNNPGYPFWIAGMEHSVGQRPPTPPLDMMTSAQAAGLQASDSTGLWSHPGFADPDAIDGWDGGLPRYTLNGYAAGSQAIISVSRLDFSKEILKAKPNFFPEEGTALEKGAMAYHAQRCHDSFLPDGTTAPCDDTGPGGTGGFIANGAPPVPGAPFQEPCADDNGFLLAEGVTGNFFSGESLNGMSTYGMSPHNAQDPRIYKAANVQLDAVFNKLGYHYPQQRIVALWQDVVPTVNKERPPEPFVMRMNTFDCAQYVHSNVVPKTYELDDYQVRTPTDIIGQHIHLPKWDLTTADGAANGWNYEDGTLSPGMVREVIEAINRWTDEEVAVTTDVEGNVVTNSNGDAITDDPKNHLHPLDHPFFGQTPYAEEWKGARSTMQRWFADPVVNVQGVDRGLGIIFTHDHYGPSTHQQIGLYSTLLIEPAGSRWVHNETGQQLGQSPDGTPGEPGRIDGGPTSWQAAILTGPDGFGSDYSQNVGGESVENHREFYFEYSDFQHAYQPGVYIGAGPDGFPTVDYHFVQGPEIRPGQFLNAAQLVAGDPDSFRDAINPPFRQQAPLGPDGFPTDVWVFPPLCPGGVPRPCPEAISADDPGMYVVNYRNESLMARVYDPDRMDCPDGTQGCQAKGRAGDLAFAMDSNVTRVIAPLNDKLGLAPATYAGNPAGCDDGTGTKVFCPAITSLESLAGGDPFTPMPRGVDGDRAHVKMQAGAHEEEHTFKVHGLKWLQAGSGFGEAKNSGWRNGQPGGISEQFALRFPLRVVDNQRGPQVDYAYTTNNALDGWTSGNWGVMRSTRNEPDAKLFGLPNNDPALGDAKIANGRDFQGICPKDAPERSYDLTAVLAEDVLPAVAGVVAIAGADPYPNSHMGRSPTGPGTLVYNPRNDTVTDPVTLQPFQGPLHDPTAILWVRTEDLEADDPGFTGNGQDVVPNDPRCWRMEAKAKYDPTLPTCPVQLKPGVPIEPVVIRARAGECLKIDLRNKLLEQATDNSGNPMYDGTGKPLFEDPGNEEKYDGKGGDADTDGDGIGDKAIAYADVKFDRMPDLASSNAQVAMVRRERNNPAGMTSFNNNLVAPSPFVGLHPALVDYDVTRADGTNVGQNPSQLIGPGEQRLVRWYAGDTFPELQLVKKGNKTDREFTLVSTPIEFGGFPLAPADKIKQGQKGLVGAGVIHTSDAIWTEDAGTRLSATLEQDNLDYNVRDFTTVWQKGASMFYSDLFPIQNVAGEGSFGVSEDAQDMGQMAINYGAEPLWFRFGLTPCNEAGACNTVANAGDAYSNGLVGGDPETPVFTAKAGDPFRLHVTQAFGPGRGSTFDLHGHSWQRDPYVCPGSADLGLLGKCDMGNGHAGRAGTGEVGSRALAGLPGVMTKEANPIGMTIGGIESVFAGEHFEIVIPSAGGGNGVTGDYLFRDHMGLGNVDGLWGILRVQ